MSRVRTEITRLSLDPYRAADGAGVSAVRCSRAVSLVSVPSLNSPRIWGDGRVIDIPMSGVERFIRLIRAKNELIFL